jgi:hypothetical protein
MDRNCKSEVEFGIGAKIGFAVEKKFAFFINALPRLFN